jgi:hypothetical protein
MTGKLFLVKCKEEMEVYKELPSNKLEVVFFEEGVLYTALNDRNTICIIDRNTRNISINKELFNNHFNLVTNG